LKLLPVLHPRHKLAYFKKANWPDDWINVAKTIVRDEYEHTYKITEGEIEAEEIEKVNDIVFVGSAASNDCFRRRWKVQRIFSTISTVFQLPEHRTSVMN
jgi:hypothetical protein